GSTDVVFSVMSVDRSLVVAGGLRPVLRPIVDPVAHHELMELDKLDLLGRLCIGSINRDENARCREGDVSLRCGVPQPGRLSFSDTNGHVTLRLREFDVAYRVRTQITQSPVDPRLGVITPHCGWRKLLPTHFELQSLSLKPLVQSHIPCCERFWLEFPITVNDFALEAARVREIRRVVADVAEQIR